MASSKSSQTTRNVLIALLSVWSIIALIIIVVWATSPDLKGASQCRKELLALQESGEHDRVEWAKDRRALESLVREGWNNQTRLMADIEAHLERLKELNASLDACRHDNVLLNANITTLENEIVVHKATEANLTAQLSLQKEEIECLQNNLTQKLHDLNACEGSRRAAVILQTVAENRTASCHASKKTVQAKLTKCQVEVAREQSNQQQQPFAPPVAPGSSAASLGPITGLLAWTMLHTLLLTSTS